MYFNINIEYLCTKKNIKKTQLADLLSTSKQSLNSILKNNNPTARTLIQISKIFNISLDDLVFKDLSEENNQNINT